MATVKVINPHPRALNLGHNGSGLTLIPGQAYEVEMDDVVEKLIAAGELNEAEAKPKSKAAATKPKAEAK